MKRCKCTREQPACVAGKELFAVQQQVATHPQAYYQAYLAYHDHLEGCRQGDLKICKALTSWRIEHRQQGQWVPYFNTPEMVPLRAWLKAQHAWRYAQIEAGQPQDHLTGYYHLPQRVVQQEHTQATVSQRAPKKNSAQDEERTAASSRAMSMLIALVIGSAQPLLTPLDRLLVQRKVIGLLLTAQGTQVSEIDIHLIDSLIDEAIRLREVLKRSTTTALLQAPANRSSWTTMH